MWQTYLLLPPPPPPPEEDEEDEDEPPPPPYEPPPPNEPLLLEDEREGVLYELLLLLGLTPELRVLVRVDDGVEFLLESYVPEPDELLVEEGLLLFMMVLDDLLLVPVEYVLLLRVAFQSEALLTAPVRVRVSTPETEVRLGEELLV